MASNTYQLVVDAVYKGGGAFQRAAGDMRGLDRHVKEANQGIKAAQQQWQAYTFALGATAGAIGGAVLATKKLYGAIREGATLQTATQRFDKLTNSIGTTADTMLGKLRTATKGMISDMALMESASSIVSLRLAENSDQVIRLATVAGTLGWDMQQLILTFANLSTMRLDALGLSVEEVKNKQSELMKQGMDEVTAFKEAVIQAGEARLDVGGVSEAEQSFKQFETAIANAKNEMLLLALELGKVTGFIDGLSTTASRMELTRKIRELNEELKRTGQMTGFEAFAESTKLGEMSVEQLAVLVDIKMAQIDNALLYNKGAWQGWGKTTGVEVAKAEQAVTIAATNIFRDLMGIQQGLDAITRQVGAGTYGGPMVLAQEPGRAAQQTANAYAVWIANINKRNRAAEEERASLLESEQAVYSYGGSLGILNQREQSLMATHSRMVSVFHSAIPGDLFGDDGAANASALNKLLYEQGEAANFTAGQLALLGVATGQMTEEQARARLKMAVLTEQARLFAQAVASGQMGFGEAVSGLQGFAVNLDATAAGQDLEQMATAADGFADSVYEAELAIDNNAANLGLMDSINLANEFAGVYTATLVTNYVTGTGSGGGGAVGAVSSGGGVVYDPTDDNRFGPFNKRGGADLLPYGGGSVYPDSRTAGMYTSYQGGPSFNVTVTNYVDGKVERSSLDDVTTDSLKRAMAEMGMSKR